MNSNWLQTEIGELANIRGGKRVPKGYKLLTKPTKHPYIRVSDFTEKGTIDLSDIHYVDEIVFKQIGNYTINKGDLYISIAGTIGKTGLVPLELDGANLTENACKLIFKENIFPRFIYYFTKTEEFINQVVLSTRVAAMPKLALTRLSKIKLHIPDSLEEQKRIVAILDKTIDAIAKARENTERNLRNTRELFDSYLESVFANPDEGWEKKKLGDICWITDGTHYSPKNTSIGKYKYITAKNIKPYLLDLSNISYISNEDHKEIYQRTPVKKGDILYIKDGATTGIAAINTLEEEFSLLSSVALIRPNEYINNSFLTYYLNSRVGKQNFLGYIDGMAITRLTLIKLKNIKIPFPKLQKQLSIVNKFDEIYFETKKLEAIYLQKLSALDDLKKSLLQKAFNGEL
jgi:type I restriction enzyme, S subunit